MLGIAARTLALPHPITFLRALQRPYAHYSDHQTAIRIDHKRTAWSVPMITTSVSSASARTSLTVEQTTLGR
jgi:hypothetical protein